MSDWQFYDWDNDKKLTMYTGGRRTGRFEYVINKASFEAGADAMLKMIKKQPTCKFTDNINDTVEVTLDGKKGKFYFIPD